MCSTSPVSEYALYVLFDSSVLMEQKTAEIVVHTWCMYFDQHLINQEYTVCVCVCVQVVISLSGLWADFADIYECIWLYYATIVVCMIL